MKIKFEKIQDLWFAIVPEYIEAGGDFNDCLMVDGAPEMLDMLSNNGEQITLIMTKEKNDLATASLKKYTEISDWGFYHFNFNSDYKNVHVGLCPVNKFAWNGIHPDLIYLQIM